MNGEDRMNDGYGGNNKGSGYVDINEERGEKPDMRGENLNDECCCTSDENLNDECCCTSDENLNDECCCTSDEDSSSECSCTDESPGEGCCCTDEGIQKGDSHAMHADEKGGRDGVPCEGKRGAKSMGHCGAGLHPMQRFMDICMLVLLYKDTCHGYSLAEKLSEFGLDEINVSTMYRSLRKMESEGWVKSSWEQGSRGPRRRVYTITEKGKSELSEKAEVLKQRRTRIETVLARYEQSIKE